MGVIGNENSKNLSIHLIILRFNDEDNPFEFYRVVPIKFMDQLFRPDRFFSPDGNGLEIDNERRETDGGGQIGEPWDGEIMISKGGQNRVGFDTYARETCLFPFFFPPPFRCASAARIFTRPWKKKSYVISTPRLWTCAREIS